MLHPNFARKDRCCGLRWGPSIWAILTAAEAWSEECFGICISVWFNNQPSPCICLQSKFRISYRLTEIYHFSNGVGCNQWYNFTFARISYIWMLSDYISSFDGFRLTNHHWKNLWLLIAKSRLILDQGHDDVCDEWNRLIYSSFLFSSPIPWLFVP